MTILTVIAIGLITFPVALGFIWILAAIGLSLSVACGFLGYQVISAFDEAKSPVPEKLGEGHMEVGVSPVSKRKKTERWHWNATQAKSV
ncbi:MAG: hypothetical protein C5B49_15040 [Bdellovibrio sp.]|nr:MAG: hypothetical protein C5B49_15040 [Bdellovibrio sp.]